MIQLFSIQIKKTMSEPNWEMLNNRATAAVNTFIDLFLIICYYVINLRIKTTAHCEVIQLIYMSNIAGERDSPYKARNRMVASEYHN